MSTLTANALPGRLLHLLEHAIPPHLGPPGLIREIYFFFQNITTLLGLTSNIEAVVKFLCCRILKERQVFPDESVSDRFLHLLEHAIPPYLGPPGLLPIEEGTPQKGLTFVLKLTQSKAVIWP